MGASTSSSNSRKHTIRPKESTRNMRFNRSCRWRYCSVRQTEADNLKENATQMESNKQHDTKCGLPRRSTSIKSEKLNSLRNAELRDSAPTPDEGKLMKLPYWHDVDRNIAEGLLLQKDQPTGAFLLRPKSHDGSFALSVKIASNPDKVGHYRITHDVSKLGIVLGGTFFYRDVQSLIQHHTDVQIGLPCCLSVPVALKVDGSSDASRLGATLHRSDIIYHKRIGSGSFGEVWWATVGRSPVAVKRIIDCSPTSGTRFLGEAEIMARLVHPNIVKMVAAFHTEPFLLVLELLLYGSMQNFLPGSSPVARELTYNQLVNMMLEVGNGMAYLESQNVLHRDLRACNVLIGEGLTVKVADFGLALIINENSAHYGNVGTKFPVRWTAPEVYVEKKYSLKSDVWSFGILLHEMVTLCDLPYTDMSTTAVRLAVPKGYVLPHPFLKLRSYCNPRLGYQHCSSEVYDLMLQCWQLQPENRPSFGEILTTIKHW